MGLFSKLFKGKKTKKGFYEVKVLSVSPAGNKTVKVELDLLDEIKSNFNFKPGQYLDFLVTINGKEYRRSYSICSEKNEPLAIGVKEVENGTVSKWFQNVSAGESLFVSTPKGNFTLPENAKKIVSIAAGSGITPILAFAKHIEGTDAEMILFYGNKTEKDILFREELEALKNTKTVYFLSQEEKDFAKKGRINKENFTEMIKADLDILKSDAFMLCGPEEMVLDISETLKVFGVQEEKIKFELFTPPTSMKAETMEDNTNFKGKSVVTMIVDGEEITFEVDANKNILDKAIDEGVDAPYSCKGGVCSSCKAKVLEGKVHMKLNYTLTDKELEENYILTCQAFPRSEKIKITYDKLE